MLLELLTYLLLKRNSRVEHHAQNGNDPQPRILFVMNPANRGNEVCKPLKCEVFALHRHDNAVGETKRIKRQHGEAWRTIDQNIVIAVHDRTKCLFQSLISFPYADQFDFST